MLWLGARLDCYDIAQARAHHCIRLGKAALISHRSWMLYSWMFYALPWLPKHGADITKPDSTLLSPGLRFSCLAPRALDFATRSTIVCELCKLALATRRVRVVTMGHHSGFEKGPRKKSYVESITAILSLVACCFSLSSAVLPI